MSTEAAGSTIVLKKFRITGIYPSFQLTDSWLLWNNEKTGKIILYNCVNEFHYREANYKENQDSRTINTCSQHYLNFYTLFWRVEFYRFQ